MSPTKISQSSLHTPSNLTTATSSQIPSLKPTDHIGKIYLLRPAWAILAEMDSHYIEN